MKTRPIALGAAMIISIALAVNPSRAASTATTGIVAGLGLNAATGKTTISDNGGVIEAALLNSESVLKAGTAIRSLALMAIKRSSAGQKILVLGHSDALDFGTARWVKFQLDQFSLKPPTCPKRPGRKGRGSKGTISTQGAGFPGSSTPAPSDIAAILATDITIQGVSLSTDDRLLVEAVLIGQDSARHWTADDPRSLASMRLHQNDRFLIPVDTADLDVKNNPVLVEFNNLSQAITALSDCPDAKVKAWVQGATAFATAVTATDKGPPAIVIAAELLTMSPDPSNEFVLRVAVEQVGGTAITRSNIFYTLGWPGAATISAGLLASFRLSDPVRGMDILTGFVRCAVSPVRFQDVRKIVAANQPELADSLVTCSVITA